MIVTEKSDLSSIRGESSDITRLEELQGKLRGLLESGAHAQFSMDCIIHGKKESVSVKSSKALGFFEKLLNKVI